jgi:glutathione S-transferase
MKLHGTSGSPYVRKVMITGIEAGLDDEIENLTPSVSVWVDAGDAGVSEENPLGKIPVLIARDGSTLIDSSVICEYLASLAPEKNFLPPSGDERWRVLNFQALAQGTMDAMIFRALETSVRPEPYGWMDWADRQTAKISRALDRFDQMAVEGEIGPVNLGSITLGSALGYLEQRQGDTSWRSTRPRLARWFDGFKIRRSMETTIPPSLPPAHLDPRRS